VAEEACLISLSRMAEEAMVGRPFWSGQLKISLVSFGIQLYPAVNPHSGVTFHQIERETGRRVRHRNVTQDDEPVENADIVKGYEYSRGKYIEIDPEEIGKLRIAAKSVIEIKQFVSLADVSLALFERPYFVLPDPRESTDAFAIVRKAMEQADKAALGEVAFGGREHLVAFAVPKDDRSRGMMAYTLRYAEELRNAADYFSGIAASNVDKKQLAMASNLIQAYSGPFDLESFQDDYEVALRELVEAKEKNLPLPLEDEQPQHPKVVGLMDALRRSLRDVQRPASRRKRAAASAPEKGPVLVKANRRKHRAA
jgi:DNA end-binding protein Ku